MIREIISYVLGAVALVLVCFSLFSKKRTSFLLIQVVANVFFGGSYIAVGAYVAGFITLVSIFRCVFLYFAEKKNFKHVHYILPIFILVYIGITIGFWSSWLDVVPLMTSTIFAYSHALKNLQTARYIMLVPETMLLGYNIFVGAYVNCATKVIELVSTIVSIVVHIKRTKKEQFKTQEVTENKAKSELQVVIEDKAKLESQVVIENKAKTES